jgi:hypothetical protein
MQRVSRRRRPARPSTPRGGRHGAAVSHGSGQRPHRGMAVALPGRLMVGSKPLIMAQPSPPLGAFHHQLGLGCHGDPSLWQNTIEYKWLGAGGRSRWLRLLEDVAIDRGFGPEGCGPGGLGRCSGQRKRFKRHREKMSEVLALAAERLRPCSAPTKFARRFRAAAARSRQ